MLDKMLAVRKRQWLIDEISYSATRESHLIITVADVRLLTTTKRGEGERNEPIAKAQRYSITADCYICVPSTFADFNFMSVFRSVNVYVVVTRGLCFQYRQNSIQKSVTMVIKKKGKHRTSAASSVYSRCPAVRPDLFDRCVFKSQSI